MDDLVYLDNAATSFPKPEAVYTFMDQFYRRFGVNPGRSGYGYRQQLLGVFQQLRDLADRFFGREWCR